MRYVMIRILNSLILVYKMQDRYYNEEYGYEQGNIDDQWDDDKDFDNYVSPSFQCF